MLAVKLMGTPSWSQKIPRKVKRSGSESSTAKPSKACSSFGTTVSSLGTLANRLANALPLWLESWFLANSENSIVMLLRNLRTQKRFFRSERVEGRCVIFATLVGEGGIGLLFLLNTNHSESQHLSLGGNRFDMFDGRRMLNNEDAVRQRTR